MGIKSSVLQYVIQEKKRFWKRPTLVWYIGKKLPKNSQKPKNPIFQQFFAYKSGYSGSFAKPFFFLNHIFQDGTFDTHMLIIWDEKNFTLNRGWSDTKMAGKLLKEP